MMRSVLAAPWDGLRREARQLLVDLSARLGRLGAPEADQRALAASALQLDELFLIVVVGEFNAGKSAVINTLLGEAILEEGATPTTARITVVTHEGAERGPGRDGLDLVHSRVAALRDVTLVDTPGTNAVLREHELVTREFVPRADLVLFVTSADRPFTESERAFIASIREWGKKVLMVVNKVDILRTPRDVEEVTRFVQEQASTLLGVSPELFLVSAKADSDEEPAQADAAAHRGIASLRTYLLETLDETERIRLKLLNPLGVATRIVEQQHALAAEQAEALTEDVAVLDTIERQIAHYREDVERGIGFRLADVDNALLEFERRGHAFFDEMLRAGRLFDLMNREKVRGEFGRVVVADLPHAVERRVDDLVGWMTTRELSQWQAIVDLLAQRQKAHASPGARLAAPLEENRLRLLEAVRREAHRVVERYDHDAEAKRLAQTVRDAIAGAALLQLGAIGIGATVAAIATTTMADVTGILAAGTVSVIGLLLLPARRKAAKAALETRVHEMREDLTRTLTTACRRELEASAARIEGALLPFTQFVRAERERLREAADSLAVARDTLRGLRSRIEAAAGRLPEGTPASP